MWSRMTYKMFFCKADLNKVHESNKNKYQLNWKEKKNVIPY